MNIAIASGKGGTGKTTVATNLAATLADQGRAVTYLDCDVEEPNGHLFLRPDIRETVQATIPVPVIDESACDGCGECVRFCQYKTLVRLGTTVMVFPELCHGCGGCMRVCPRQAITEQPRPIGVVETGASGTIGFVHGRLDIGEAMSPPLIRAVLAHAAADVVNIIDAPPGTSCPVIAAIRTVDYVALVTEPTPFGLNDLGLALDMVRELGVACGVVVNRNEHGNDSAHLFCKRHDVTLVGVVPDDRRIAEAYAGGRIACRISDKFAAIFHTLWGRIGQLAVRRAGNAGAHGAAV